MIIVGGESDSDLNDIWVFSFIEKQWVKPQIIGGNLFRPKWFLSASTIKKDKVITFGGCHSEYVHLNDLNIFEFQDFLENPNKFTNRCSIICTRVDTDQNVPDSWWGHAAVVYESNLYILGGWNDHDLNDIHRFNIENQKWKTVSLVESKTPKSRRRHSCVMIGRSIVMFGGFDGEFFNDLHVLPLKSIYQDHFQI